MTGLRASIAAAALLIALPATASDPALDGWFDEELVPAVTERLQNHPRFKGQTVMFIVIDGNEPAAVSNRLALSLRDRLLNAALDAGNVRIGWRQGSAGSLPVEPAGCRRETIDYYVGVDIDRRLDRRYEIRVRAMDLVDGSWVGGFGRTWRGSLSGPQQRALQDTVADSTFLGARDVPFTSAQTDLLARHLTHELSCALSGQTSGEYILAMPEPATDNVFAGALDLVSRNIATHSAVTFTANPERRNAELSASAHAVDRTLHQYALTIAPADAETGLAPLTVTTYVVLPEAGDGTGAVTAQRPVSTGVPGPGGRPPDSASIPTAGGNPLLSPLRVTVARDASECRSGPRFLPASMRWSGDEHCSLLTATAHADAIVFVLEHQPQLGLVRIGDAECRERTTARIVRGGGVLKFPIARFGSIQARRTDEWLVAPDADTYYAIAIADARAARRLANHIDRLPIRCGSSLRPGLSGSAMRRWLDEFARLASQSAGSLDWRAVQLSDVL